MKVSLVTTWETHCGLAYYSRHLSEELKKIVDVEIIKVDPSFTTQQYLESVATASGDVAQIEYAGSIYNGREDAILNIFHEQNIPVVMTAHGADFHRFFGKVTTITALNRTQRGAISEEAMPIIPHGVTCYPKMEREEAKKQLGITRQYVVSEWGFILPHKRYELILNAVKDWEDTCFLIAGSEERDPYYWARLQTVMPSIKAEVIKTGFLDETQISAVFGASDLAVFPYAMGIDSGCLRYTLGSKVLSLGSPIPFMQELNTIYGVPLIGLSIRDLLEHGYPGFEENCERFAEENSWATVAKQHVALYNQILEARK